MAQTIESKLIDELQGSGLLDAEKIESCRRIQQDTRKSLWRIAVEQGYLSEKSVLEVFSRLLDIPFVPQIDHLEVPRLFIDKVSLQYARSQTVIGVGIENGRMKVATQNPLNLRTLDDLAVVLSMEVEPVFATTEQIVRLINKAYQGEGESLNELLDELDDEALAGLARSVESSEDLLDMANKAPIIKLVNMFILRALRLRASDIHIHPYEDKVIVRYRIDGMLYDMDQPPKRLQEAIISRVKVLGRMDIAERRFPQDGRATIRVADREIDLRISSVPTSHGERIVMRILDKSGGLLKLEDIGLSEENLQKIYALLTFSHGIFLLSGPTGSGKTTTLYAALNRINTSEKNIITIEDPIEYQLPGISQIEVVEKKGLTFAEGLRSVLRQDPNVLMVGEIRDHETARVAIQCALTGHLVFSTVHTNDAPSAATRLLDLGVEPYLVSSSVIAVMAQRLVRLICRQCAEPFEPSERDVASIGLPPGTIAYRGKGCDHCMNSGYYGRTGIYELMIVDDTIRAQIMAREGASVMKKGCVERGMKTLRMDGAEKVRKGLTTIEEVRRVTQMDIF